MSLATKRLIFSLIFLLGGCVITVASVDFTPIARYMPVAVGGFMASMALLGTIVEGRNVLRARRDPEFEKSRPVVSVMDNTDDDHGAIGRIGRYFAWWLCFLLALAIVSTHLAVLLFLTGFLRIEARFEVWKALLSALVVIAFLQTFVWVFELRLPSGLYVPPIP
jgi:hypothetical protein